MSEEDPTSNIFMLIRDKKSFNIQKDIYEFINNSDISEKIEKKQEFNKLIDLKILDLSAELAKLHKMEVKSNLALNESILKAFESLISKSFHNTFITTYEQEDIQLNSLILRVKEILTVNNLTLEDFMRINVNKMSSEKNSDLLNLQSQGNINQVDYENQLDKAKILNKIIKKFKEDLYFYQGSNEKLICINSLFKKLREEIFEVSSLTQVSSKSIRRLLSYIIVKGEISRLYSNLLFIINFKLSSLMSSYEVYFIHLLMTSLKRLRIKVNKYHQESSIENKKLVNTTSLFTEDDTLDKISQNMRLECSLDQSVSHNLNNEKIRTDKSYKDDYITEITYDKDKVNKTEIDSDENSDFDLSIRNIDNNENYNSLDEFQKKELLSFSQTLGSLDTKKLRELHFKSTFKNFDSTRFESMSNDFKISMKLIESYKSLHLKKS